MTFTDGAPYILANPYRTLVVTEIGSFKETAYIFLFLGVNFIQLQS